MDVLTNVLQRVDCASSRLVSHAMRRHCDAARTSVTLTELTAQPTLVKEMHTFLSRLPHLTTLEATAKVADVAAGLGVRTQLTQLTLTHAKLEDLPPITSACPQLVSVQLMIADRDDRGEQACDVAALAACSNLESLSIDDDGSLVDIGALATCPKLTSVTLSGCRALLNATPLSSCLQLTSLVLNDVPLATLSHIAPCTKLASLSSKRCDALTDIAALASCSSLTSLYLGYCGRLSDIAPLSTLTGLSSLSLASCFKVRTCVPLASCSRLQKLDLSGCSIKQVQPVCRICNELTWLSISACRQLADLSSLTALTQLAHLNMSFLPEVDLSCLLFCKQLTWLDISYCHLVANLHVATLLPQLLHFEVGHSASSSPTHLALIAGYCPALTSFSLIAKEATDISALSACTGLTSITFDGHGVSDIRPVAAACPDLSAAAFHECLGLTDLSPLAACRELTTLVVNGCSRCVDVAFVTTLEKLERLTITRSSLVDVRPVALCPRLTHLDLGTCYDLVDIAALASCTRLRFLDVHQCRLLKDVSALVSCGDLRCLRLGPVDVRCLGERVRHRIEFVTSPSSSP